MDAEEQELREAHAMLLRLVPKESTISIFRNHGIGSGFGGSELRFHTGWSVMVDGNMTNGQTFEECLVRLNLTPLSSKDGN